MVLGSVDSVDLLVVIFLARNKSYLKFQIKMEIRADAVLNIYIYIHKIHIYTYIYIYPFMCSLMWKEKSTERTSCAKSNLTYCKTYFMIGY